VRRKRPNSSNWKSDDSVELERAHETGVAREVLVRLEGVEPGVEEHVLRHLARVVLSGARRRDPDGVEVRPVPALVTHLAPGKDRLQRDRARKRKHWLRPVRGRQVVRHDVGDEARDAQQVLRERTRVRRAVGALGVDRIPSAAEREARQVDAELRRLALVTEPAVGTRVGLALGVVDLVRKLRLRPRRLAAGVVVSHEERKRPRRRDAEAMDERGRRGVGRCMAARA
jgi:ribosomal protein S25